MERRESVHAGAASKLAADAKERQIAPQSLCHQVLVASNSSVVRRSAPAARTSFGRESRRNKFKPTATAARKSAVRRRISEDSDFPNS